MKYPQRKSYFVAANIKTMLKLEVYTGFRGTPEDCLKIWEAWEERVEKRTDRMTLKQFAKTGGVYWNGYKLVPETAPQEIVEKPLEFFTKWLGEPDMRSRVRAAIVKSEVAYTNKFETDEIDELVDDIMNEIEGNV